MVRPATQRTDALAHALFVSLSTAIEDEGRAKTLARELAQLSGVPGSAEASARIAKDGSIRTGRMMLERAPVEVARRIASGLGLPWRPESEGLASACAGLGVPMIAGWDVGGDEPLYKLYANASDASDAVRERLHVALGLAAQLPRAHVVGLNVTADRTATKLYVQRESLAALGVDRVPDALAALPAIAWVASHDIAGASTTPRAVFAAPRHHDPAAVESAVLALARTSWTEIGARLPFAPGPVRQIGWSFSGDVTVYAKQADQAAPVSLVPLAVFRAGNVEVGLHVDPAHGATSAFSRTARHALAFRTREGEPDRDQLAELGRYAHAAVERAERDGGAPDLDAPPPPWKRIREA